MKENNLKNFYKKVMHLLKKSKKELKKEKNVSNLLLLNLDIHDIQKLISLLEGEEISELSGEKLDISSIIFEYLEEALDIIIDNWKEIEYSYKKKFLQDFRIHIEIEKEMISSIKSNDILKVVHILINSYEKIYIKDFKFLITRTLQKIGKPIILALVHLLYKSTHKKDSEIPDILKEVGELAIPALVLALNHPEENVRYNALNIIKRLNSNKATDSIIETLLNDSSWKIRKLAAETLGIIKDKKTVPGLIKGLKDKHPGVRLEIAKALGEIKDEAVLIALLKLLDDPSWEVRRKAVESMAKFGSKASKYLAKALENDSLVVRKIASRILAEIGTEEAIPALMKALYDNDISVRERVVAALGRIQKKNAVITLQHALEDKAPLVRFTAIQVLMDIGNLSTIHLLKNAELKENEQIIKQRIQKAIKSILERENKR